MYRILEKINDDGEPRYRIQKLNQTFFGHKWEYEVVWIAMGLSCPKSFNTKEEAENYVHKLKLEDECRSLEPQVVSGPKTFQRGSWPGGR